jgi:hypothetical protein
MLVVTLESRGCAPAGQFDLRIAYQADAWSHDMSRTVSVRRGQAGAAATQLFIPIFMEGFQEQVYMRFSGIEVPGGTVDCVSAVARFKDRAAIPLWVELQLPPDWREGPLHQSLRTPWPLRRFR